MNATATKSVKDTKKTVLKATAATRAKPAGKSAKKSPVQPLAKKAVKATAKPLKAVAKPVVKSAPKAAKKPAAKSAVKSPTVAAKGKAPATKKSSPVKSVKPAAKAAAETKSTGKAVTNSVKKVIAAAKKPAVAATVPNKDASRSQAGSDKKTGSGSVDKIEQAVVSKVRELATKSSKTNPAAAGDGTLLTEAQIMKMGEKDYMNEAQLAFFKHRLQQLEKDLLKNADETTEHLRETVLVPDPADRATIEEEHALELRTRDRERKLLKKVQQSIASIDAGDYGWCEETGEPIGVPRLLARPTATLSLEAQQRRELKQKLYGD